MPRIGLVHALRDSMVPVDAALAALWPEAEAAHLFDGSLYLDRSRGTASAAEIDRRVAALIAHSAAAGAEGILFTGSFFGAAVRAARQGMRIPVLTSYDGLVEAAFARGGRFAILATARDSVDLLRDDLTAHAAMHGLDLHVDGHFVPEAMEALLRGDGTRHDELVAAAAAAMPDCDAILLAQFSMAPAKALAGRRSGRPVLTAPEAGVARLRELLLPG